ncbi:UDP-N-acetyl-D-mannosaminuronic acid dehydrogenase [Arthrobacter pigmenti]|uniref:UDP-N-acetyl-D-mannosaminuronic acid dehydrogenase n=1 Tax=Arthrobacter pigmenti TaxID=271432 RepID=A0A846RWN2_9MICC|nr:UDP-N-acetyl-D-mannosamine dehydrogenase [Arthrobacter pigmenti]NJC22641.1 UDP-N-acetyl-D-mannosaminuronic acid dehydrogenase [Arthrobacter pigmenti]
MGQEIFDVAVIGLGYIGLPTAATFAARGCTVAGVDLQQSTVDAVNRGEVPFVEPDLGAVLSGVVSKGSFKAFTTMPKAQAYIIAVPTPVTADKNVDLSYLWSAAKNIAPALTGGELIILESTSPPGTTKKLGDYLISERPDLALEQGSGENQIFLAHSPERVLPGRIMIEIVANDRVVGGLTNEAAEKAKKLYEVICQGQIHVTDASTAEMTKIAENSFRDLNIAFANQLALIANELGIDVWRLIELANHHPRVNILQPGPGVGGHCIAVDPWFLVGAFPDFSSVTRAARELNDSMPARVVERIVETVAHIEKPTVCLLGLSFKANIDDTRESPSVEVALGVAEALSGSRILCVDPHVVELPQELAALDNIELVDVDVAIDANIVVLLVNHDEFTDIHSRLNSSALIVDTRGVWPSAEHAELVGHAEVLSS